MLPSWQLLATAPRLLGDSVQVKQLLKGAKIKINEGDLDSASFYVDKLRQLVRGSKAANNEMEYLKVYSILLSRQSKHQEARKHAASLLALSLRHKDRHQIAEAYHIMATVCQIAGDLNHAAANVIKAIKVSEGLNNKKEQALYYYNLGNVFFNLREPDKALLYANKGYLLARQINNPDLMAGYRLRISMHEMMAGHTERALKLLKESEQFFLQRKDVDQLSDTYLYFSHVYFEQKNYPAALAYVKKIIPLLPDIKVQKRRFNMHVESAMAEIYMKLGEYKIAQTYFDRNISQVDQYMDANDTKEMYQIGATIYENVGDLKRSLAYLKQHKKLSDSVNNVRLKSAIHEIEIKYQTSIKEKALAQQKLQLANKNIEIEQKNKYLFYGLIGFILVILTVVIIYLIYRNKNQSIELSLLKAQIHPHFLFNTLNNLYALTLNKADEAPAVVLGLSRILRYILYECNALKADLKKEMDMIAAYISLEQTRYEHRLEVNVNIRGELTNKQIAPLLILPLVENAFKHGVSKLMDDAWINIDANVKGDRFIFKISNNTPEEVKVDPSALQYGNIGLMNIQKRLHILYPKKHRLKITNDQEIFLVVMELSL